MKGAIAVISSDEARVLLDSMDVSNLVRLRDRAITAVMAYTFARVSAVGNPKSKIITHRKSAGDRGCTRKTAK